MRIAMMQMAMTEDMERNLQVSYEAVKEAAGADLLFVAMCNRVGREGDVTFAGQSLVVDSEGQTLLKAGDEAGLVYCDIDLKKCKESRQARPYITLRRPEFYR